MATKRNDSKGYEVGARGIDGKKGEGWQEDHVDWGAINKMFGRQWAHNGLKGGKGDYTSPSNVNGTGGHSADQLIKGAKGKWVP